MALLTSAVILLGACAGVFVFKDEILALITGYEDVYSVANDTKHNAIVDENFQNAELTERQEIIQEVLDELELDGEIEAVSISYQEDDALFCFSYSNGAYDWVMLEEFSPYYAGTDSSYMEFDDDGVADFDSYDPYVTFDDMIEYPYEDTDLSALIMYGAGKNDENDSYYRYLEFLYEEQEVWNAEI